MRTRKKTVPISMVRTITEVEKTCLVCGTTFWGRTNQTYCSRACQNRRYYQQNRERLTAERRDAYQQKAQAKGRGEDTT